jgi:drug/metabolite transporter (DMT)-like permease
VGLIAGEAASFHWSGRAAAAMVYLVIFGSIVGYSSYSYALRHAPATIVGTYAYVNPVIAVVLGGLLLHEPVTARTFVAMALILGAVVWIQFSHLVAAVRTAPSSAGAPVAATPAPRGAR